MNNKNWMHEHALRKLVKWITATALDKDTDSKERKTLRVQLHKVKVSYDLSLVLIPTLSGITKI